MLRLFVGGRDGDPGGAGFDGRLGAASHLRGDADFVAAGLEGGERAFAFDAVDGFCLARLDGDGKYFCAGFEACGKIVDVELLDAGFCDRGRAGRRLREIVIERDGDDVLRRGAGLELRLRVGAHGNKGCERGRENHGYYD